MAATPPPGPGSLAHRHQQDVFSQLYGSAEAATAYLDQLEAETSLLEFIRLMWPILEPGREFVSGWAVEAICEHLEAVTRGELRKLLINVPPGCMKSLTTNVFWPAWEWGPKSRSTLRYIGASYSADLTIRDNRRTRQLIQSDVYQRNWGDRFEFVGDQNAKVRFDTSAKGWKIATSVGGLGTGERGDRFVIDDPHNVKETESDAKRDAVLQWFTEVVPTRINDARRSAIIVIMQRVHDQDVSGLILREDLGYEHLVLPMEFEPAIRSFTSVPREGAVKEKVTRVMCETDPLPKWVGEEELALLDPESDLPPGYEARWHELYCQDRRTLEGELLWPERFPQDYLDDELKPTLRAWGGSFAEAGQLQQSPIPRGGGSFQRDWFQYLDEEPDGVQWVRGWDLAGTDAKKEKKSRGAAYTAGVRMGLWKGRVVVADVVRDRWSPLKVEQKIRSTAQADGFGTSISIPQDPGQAGLAQKAHLAAKLHGYRVHFSTESGSKETRAEGLASQAEAHNLYLVRGRWNNAFVGELCLFPNGTFKDQVDAASRAYDRLVRKKRRTLGGAPMQVQ